MAQKIGITGGIGSGKTTICKIFEVLGIPVYYADDRAKELMTTHPELMGQIKERFGAATYHPDGSLNRPHLAQIVFNDPQQLNQLNAIVHPAVARDSMEWHRSQEATGVPYTMKEAALLFESGSYQQLDQIITVFAPRDLRLQRVMERDKSDRQAIEARMDKQMPEAEKLELAHYIINNNGHQALIPQIMNIHSSILTTLG